MAKKTGRMWVDGTKLHFVGPDLVEWYYQGTTVYSANGSNTNPPTGTPGQIELYDHPDASVTNKRIRYVGETVAGHAPRVYELGIDTTFSGVNPSTNGDKGTCWCENGFIHWVCNDSGQEARAPGPTLVGS